MPSCPFCDIVTGGPAAQVWEDQGTIAFLDRRPVFPGHVLVIPRAHVETLADLPAPAVGPLFTTVRHVAVAVEEGMAADGTFVALNNRVSQSVPHLHVHVVPRRFKDGLRGFFWPRQHYESEAAMAEVAATIARAAGWRPG